jgi:hypothetical protein
MKIPNAFHTWDDVYAGTNIISGRGPHARSNCHALALLAALAQILHIIRRSFAKISCLSRDRQKGRTSPKSIRPPLTAK